MRFANRFAVIAILGLLWIYCLPVVTAQETPTNQPVTAVAFRAINVRSGPSTDYEIVGQLYEGQIVSVIGRSDPQSNWLLIDHDGEIGWVAFFTVALTGDPTTVEIVGTASANTPLATLQPSPTAILEGAQSALYVTAYRRVNVRSGPGTEFSIVDVLAPGETADIVGSSGEDNEWIKIRTDDQTGWVAYFVVNVSGNLSALVASESTAAELQPSFIAQAAVTVPALESNQVLLITRFNTNLRAEPHFGAEVVTVVPYETTLEAEARTADSNWLRVSYNGETGWLIASLVNTGVSDVESLRVEPVLPETTATPS
jgi:uncharacterized protein YraI